LNLFGTEDNRVEIFGKYIGATQFTLQNEIKKEQIKDSEKDSFDESHLGRKQQSKMKSNPVLQQKDQERKTVRLLRKDNLKFSKLDDSGSDQDIDMLGLELIRRQRRKWRKQQNKLQKNNPPLALTSESEADDAADNSKTRTEMEN
jgi:hypothetical protein